MQTFKLNYESVIYIFLNVVNELHFQNIYILVRLALQYFWKKLESGRTLECFFCACRTTVVGSYNSSSTPQNEKAMYESMEV